jgi:hypothetical protein
VVKVSWIWRSSAFGGYPASDEGGSCRNAAKFSIIAGTVDGNLMVYRSIFVVPMMRILPIYPAIAIRAPTPGFRISQLERMVFGFCPGGLRMGKDWSKIPISNFYLQAGRWNGKAIYWGSFDSLPLWLTKHKSLTQQCWNSWIKMLFIL